MKRGKKEMAEGVYFHLVFHWCLTNFIFSALFESTVCEYSVRAPYYCISFFEAIKILPHYWNSSVLFAISFEYLLLFVYLLLLNQFYLQALCVCVVKHHWMLFVKIKNYLRKLHLANYMPNTPCLMPTLGIHSVEVLQHCPHSVSKATAFQLLLVLWHVFRLQITSEKKNTLGDIELETCANTSDHNAWIK